jgi:hypothetical protein
VIVDQPPARALERAQTAVVADDAHQADTWRAHCTRLDRVRMLRWECHTPGCGGVVWKDGSVSQEATPRVT